jgi:hypothetical protein
MNAQILSKRSAFTMRRLVLAAIGISFFVLSTTTFGADLRTDHPSAVATAPARRYAIPAHPTDPPLVNAQTSPAFVDRLYKDLMAWTSPPCLSATNNASRRGPLSELSFSAVTGQAQ